MQNYFETIRCEDYVIAHLEYHIQRVARTVGLNINLQEYIFPPSNQLLKCKLIYNEEGVQSVEFTPYVKKRIESFQLVYDDDIIYDKKSTNREDLERLYAQRKEADEIIIIKNGLVTDTSIANIAIFDAQHWLTPKKPLLLGTTRQRLLRSANIIERDIGVQELLAAKKVMLLNAMVQEYVLEDYSFFS